MSAFIVDRKHINYLVDGASQLNFSYYFHDERRCATSEHLNNLGQMLWDENVASVKYRYPNEPVESLPGPIGESLLFKHSFVMKPLNPVALLKAISCYEYQSCEHPGWVESESKVFCDNLRKAAIRHLPGYDDVVWEVVS